MNRVELNRLTYRVLAVTGLSLVAFLATRSPAAEERSTSIAAGREGDAVVVKLGDRQVLRYELKKPADVKLPVDSGGYFHPVMTPAGVVVTDVSPADHPHHRGVFLAWVETHGKADADFWGWGEHAPIKGRRIVNREVGQVGSDSRSENGRSTASARFSVRNDWVADEQPVMREDLRVAVHAAPEAKANVIDLTYTLTPAADLTLARWAFSGFCVRSRGPADAPQITAYGPGGEVKLPNPSHLKPESDWPAAPWYDYTFKLKDGTVAGVAVIDHAKNPPSLWHNHRDIRMLNPCIVAPMELTLKANKPLVLRYRVVAHDGPVPKEQLDELARDWRVE
jgi:hypothetical protein